MVIKFLPRYSYYTYLLKKNGYIFDMSNIFFTVHPLKLIQCLVKVAVEQFAIVSVGE